METSNKQPTCIQAIRLYQGFTTTEKSIQTTMPKKEEGQRLDEGINVLLLLEQKNRNTQRGSES